MYWVDFPKRIIILGCLFEIQRYIMIFSMVQSSWNMLRILCMCVYVCFYSIYCKNISIFISLYFMPFFTFTNVFPFQINFFLSFLSFSCFFPPFQIKQIFLFFFKFISASILLNLLLISADSWHLNKISPHPQQPVFPTHLICGCPIHSHNCTFLKPTLLAGMHTRSKTCTKVDNLQETLAPIERMTKCGSINFILLVCLLLENICTFQCIHLHPHQCIFTLFLIHIESTYTKLTNKNLCGQTCAKLH